MNIIIKDHSELNREKWMAFCDNHRSSWIHHKGIMFLDNVQNLSFALIDGNQTLKDAHDLTEEIEQAIQKVLPKADVTVHPEPDLEKSPNQ
jgi:uncharacterized protein YktB (UPF0637 family)